MQAIIKSHTETLKNPDYIFFPIKFSYIEKISVNRGSSF